MFKFRFIIFIGFMSATVQSSLYAAASSVGTMLDEEISLTVTLLESDEVGQARVKRILGRMNAQQDEVLFAEATGISSTFATLPNEGKSEAVGRFLGVLKLSDSMRENGPSPLFLSVVAGFGPLSDAAYNLLSAHYFLLYDLINPLYALSRHYSSIGVKNIDADGRMQKLNKLTAICARIDDLVWPAFEVFAPKPVAPETGILGF